MNSFALALLVFLVFSPFGRCATMATPTTQTVPSTCPDHPSPKPQDCAKPACTCLAAKPATNSVLVTCDQGLAVALLVGKSRHAEQHRDLATDERDAYAPRQRFLAIHQFRI